jgi:hypothetical protein
MDKTLTYYIVGIFSIINVCLSWWVRDPDSYTRWRTNVQTLPCPNTLRKYKNCLQQKPGFNENLLTWMKQEADRINLKPYQRVGGIVLDEMSIQEDIALVHKGVQTHYTGQVSITPHCAGLIEERKG